MASTDVAMICALAIWTSPARPQSCSIIRSAPDPTHRQDKPVRGAQDPTGIARWPGCPGAHFPNRRAGDPTVPCLMGPGITTSLAHGNRPRRPGYPSAPRTGTLGRTAERERIQSVRTRTGVSTTVGSFIVLECGELCLARRPHRPNRHVGCAQLDSEFFRRYAPLRFSHTTRQRAPAAEPRNSLSSHGPCPSTAAELYPPDPTRFARSKHGRLHLTTNA